LARKERYLVGLDVGTSKVTAVVGEVLDGGGLDIVGLGVAESHGIRRGVVVNLEAAVDSITVAQPVIATRHGPQQEQSLVQAGRGLSRC
jgi:cell division ATPase FtsA